MANEGPASSLLALPDTCLVKVLQCCAADDQRNLFSAARAHSRLHQTAVAALRSLTAYVPHQQQVDGVLLYLGKAGRSIDSITLQGRERFKRAFAVRLRQLPPGLELTSLQLDGFHLQLQLGDGCMGVLGAAAPAASLTRLVLWHCELLDSGDATQVLAAAFAQLPAGLEHLSINSINSNDGKLVQFPTGALQRFDHLTYLQMSGMRVKGPDEASPALQPLEALTRLVELQIKLAGDVDDQVTPSMLAAAHHLTRLQLVDCKIQTGVLVGHTQLLHLDLHYCKSPDGAAGVAQLLAHLEPLQQLTHLGIVDSLGNGEGEGGTPPAAAYAALTAGSSLRDLDLRWCTLPPGVWQHVFPAGRQLQHLQSLDLGNVRRAGGSYYGPAPAGSLLVSCCPGLRSLIMQYLGLSGAETLGPLRGLTGLHTLRLAVLGTESAQGLQSVGELTGLRELTIGCNGDTKESILRRLTLLQQLTKLDVGGLFTEPVNLTCEIKERIAARLKQERSRLEARLETQLEEERQALLEKKRKAHIGASSSRTLPRQVAATATHEASFPSGPVAKVFTASEEAIMMVQQGHYAARLIAGRLQTEQSLALMARQNSARFNEALRSACYAPLQSQQQHGHHQPHGPPQPVKMPPPPQSQTWYRQVTEQQPGCGPATSAPQPTAAVQHLQPPQMVHGLQPAAQQPGWGDVLGVPPPYPSEVQHVVHHSCQPPQMVYGLQPAAPQPDWSTWGGPFGVPPPYPAAVHHLPHPLVVHTQQPAAQQTSAAAAVHGLAQHSQSLPPWRHQLPQPPMGNGHACDSSLPPWRQQHPPQPPTGYVQQTAEQQLGWGRGP